MNRNFAKSKLTLSHLPRQISLTTQHSTFFYFFVSSTTMARNTRTANTAQHAGDPGKKRHRHTKAEMEEYRTQEAEKQKQKDLDQKAKVDQITSVEQRLTDELDVTPRPAIKQRLRHTTAFLELPLDGNPKDSIADESGL